MDADEPLPTVRSLLSRHPVIRAGWLVRGVGCAAWFAFPLGLAVLGAAGVAGVLLGPGGRTPSGLCRARPSASR